MKKSVAIVGGGAAGFFCAINLKEMSPQSDVTIFEAAGKLLRKVEVSGGGRCNCTNTFRDVTDLKQVYPRGHRLLKRLFNTFNQEDAYRWFESHGIRLTIQEDQCVFPESQDSHSIINLFLHESQRLHIGIRLNHRVDSLDELKDYDFVVVTTGGSPQAKGLQWLQHEIVPPVPSLFTFNIDDERLKTLMGTVTEQATVSLSGTKIKASGPLLITHWGMSGPAILKVSSHGARLLSENNYQMPLNVNWVSRTESEVREELNGMMMKTPQRQVAGVHPFDLSTRLWTYLAEKSIGARAVCKWKELNQKDLNRLANTLTNDTFCIMGKSAFRDEFVTCGGIALTAVQPQTLESKSIPNLFFSGEVLDIDGITGGFNFQAAWTTGHTVAAAIAGRIQ